MLEFSLEELKKAATDFHKITNITIVLYDAERKVIYAYPENINGFCRAVRENPELYKRCIECNNYGFNQCQKTGRPYIYTCHMNLFEAVAPITENNVIIGYMMMGQILEDGTYQNVKKCAEETAIKYGLDYENMCKALVCFKSVTADFIDSASSMMSMCACYLYYNKIIKKKSDLLMYRLQSYVEANYTGDISVSSLCNRFFIFKSKLYSISKTAFGMGISDYIRKKRLEEAKKLLKETDKPINSVAEESGFSDTNYFIRIFKKEEGITPNRYRKTVQN